MNRPPKYIEFLGTTFQLYHQWGNTFQYEPRINLISNDLMELPYLNVRIDNRCTRKGIYELLYFNEIGNWEPTYIIHLKDLKRATLIEANKKAKMELL